MTLIHEYMEQCNDIDSAENLCLQTFQFLKDKKYDCTLFRHDPPPDSLRILGSNNPKSLDEWYKIFTSFELNRAQAFILNQKYVYCFSDTQFLKNTVYFLAVEKEDRAKEILSIWRSLISFYKKTYLASWQEAEKNYGNLISQLMHDIQSLMDSNKSNDIEIVRRIEYQKKLNKDLLFYIRDFDLFKTTVPVKNFIEDSLRLIDIKPSAIKTHFKKEDLYINVDVELFSDVFNVIVKNALRATENDLSGIEIQIYSRDSGSPFLKESWIVFEIKDSGSGIAQEFEPFISKPFFTTHKHSGHTGFGLTNAQKIITAHNGFLDISSGNGTTVKMFIPWDQR